jgi:hypothetical protein
MTSPRPDRRRYPRVEIRFGVRVRGYSQTETAWEELTTSENASVGGVAFRISRPVATGQVLLLSMAMPGHLRRYDEDQAAYSTYALVRAVQAQGGVHRVTVRFLGRQPPRGFATNRTGRYFLPGDAVPKSAPSERRSAPRYPLFLNLRLQRLEAIGDSVERTVTENLGLAGACVPTSLPIAKGENVLIEEVDGDFSSQAQVCGVHIGMDNVPRLHLSFQTPVPSRLVVPAI